MTQPDNSPLPNPNNGFDGYGIAGLGDFILGLIVLKPLSQLLSWISGRPAEDFDTTEELRTEFFNWIDNIPLIGPLVQMITGVVGPLQQIGSFFSDLVGRALQGLNPFNGLFSGLQNVFFHQASVSNTASSAAATASQAQSTVVNVTNSVNYIADVVNVKAGRSFSESGPDPTADTSFEYENVGRDGNATITATQARGAVVRGGGASRKRGLSYMARLASGTITGFYLDLFKMDADGTWKYTGLSTADRRGVLGGGMVLDVVNLPQEFLADVGDSFGVQFRVTGSGTVEIPINNVLAHLAFSSIVPLARGWVRDPSSAPTPASIAPGAMASLYTETTPWVGIGMDLNAAQPSRSFTDNFNYDTATLARNFNLFYPAGQNVPVIEGGGFSYNRQTGQDGWGGGAYIQPLISDNWFCEVRLYGQNDRPHGMYVGSATGVGLVMVVDSSQGLRYISSANGNWFNLDTTRRIVGAVKGGGLWRLERRVNPGNAAPTIVVFRDNVEVDRWDDTQGWVPSGAGSRYFGPVGTRFSFAFSGTVDDLAFGDIPVAAMT